MAKQIGKYHLGPMIGEGAYGQYVPSTSPPFLSHSYLFYHLLYHLYTLDLLFITYLI